MPTMVSPTLTPAEGGRDHIKDLIDHVLHLAVWLLSQLIKLVDDRAEEVAHLKCAYPPHLPQV
eukprot:CAMPEP_0181249646 /NCGR_PEP_ID=MMETSP1096-20121128/45877_1 /TAXON_ID=156174 ORGANISM="Chrysochromulina ericina, Strain CCMP281" /NCGR_SAMPLE_ID=MMETSP1096 /ASSEMBLY_ACC=CAM_ASM_000453 /LENGTH=62 /DNA_ID=CAMNT_0023347021 /DNA_START=299 /DNA_END=484 /DNA_ORIENTATION=+